MDEIQNLKKLVSHSKKINEPINYFFDLIDQGKLFRIKGHRQIKQLSKYSELIAVNRFIKSELKKTFDGDAVDTMYPIFYEIPHGNFYHGMYISSVIILPITILYFSDIQTGVFAFTYNRETKMFRFTMGKVPSCVNIH